VSDSFVGELQGMLDGFREQRENMLKTQHAVAEISATATAPKHAFEVTVGAQGEIKKLSFPTEAFRRMAPAELASVIEKTIGKARADAAKAMNKVMAPYLPEGFSLANVAAGKPDWDKLGFDALPTTVDELLGGRFGSVDEAPEVGRGR
jgi:DNA-binding protein YbaB